MNTQAEQALSFANERRAAMRSVRLTVEDLDLRKGCEHVATLLTDPSDHEAAIPVGRLLMAIDRFGHQSMVMALRAAGIVSADRRVRDLTDRQRAALVLILNRRAATYLNKNHRRSSSWAAA